MTALRWIWLVVEPHGILLYALFILGIGILGVGATVLGSFLIKVRGGRRTWRVAGWVILALGLLPALWVASLMVLVYSVAASN